MNRPLTDRVRSFVARHLESLEALEILLLLFTKATDWWSAQMVSRHLDTGPRTAERCLERFAAEGLLDVRLGSAVLFRYRGPGSPLDDDVRALARAYHSSPFAVTQMISSRRLEELRSFSEAFRIRRRKGGDDGGR